MPKRPWRISGPKTKRVIRRSMYEHVQGTTVRFVEPKDLPTGCCALVGGENGSQRYTCTMKMTHVELTTEMRWVPAERAQVPVVKLLGYCMTHRPKKVEGGLLHLHNYIIRQINSSSNIEAKMKRMQNAMFVDVASPGSNRVHSIERSVFNTVSPDSNWGVNATTICGKTLKEAVVINNVDRKEDPGFSDCPACKDKKEVVA